MGQDRLRTVRIREIHAATDPCQLGQTGRACILRREEIILPDIPDDELDDTPVWRSDSDRDDGIPAADEDESEVE